jgi:predicted DsbA family dithiol-disulfide isomerase
MRIDIVSDTICPWCYIGKRRLERALAQRPELDVEIHWRPFQLNPDMPIEGKERQGYLAQKFGSPDRADQVFKSIREAARSEGLALAFERIQRTPNTLQSHRLIRFAGEYDRQDEVVESLFRRYFIDGENIGDVEVLVAVAVEAGLDGHAVRDYLATTEGLQETIGEDGTARRMGIEGVPCFIVEGKYAVFGAQSPDVFLKVFETVAQVQQQAAVETAPAS